jgi:hypothetical protein
LLLVQHGITAANITAVIRYQLSGFIKVLNQSDPGPARCIEVRLQLAEQGRGYVLQGVEIIPPAMAGEFVLEVAPDPLDQIELGTVSGQPQWLDALVVRLPPGAGLLTGVIANVIEDEHELRVGIVAHEVVQKAQKGNGVFPGADSVDQLSAGVVEGTKDREALIHSGG